jgi:hypothetical protein
MAKRVSFQDAVALSIVGVGAICFSYLTGRDLLLLVESRNWSETSGKLLDPRISNIELYNPVRGTCGSQDGFNIESAVLLSG